MKLRGLTWTIGAELARASLGAASFLLLAHALGASGFGVTVAVSALVAILTPLCTLGTTWLTQADNKTPLGDCTSAFATLALTALVPLSVAVGAGVGHVLQIPILVAILLVYAELVCQWFLTSLGSSHLGLGSHGGYFTWTFAASVVRVTSALLTYFTAATITSWAISFAALGTLTTIVAVMQTRALPRWRSFRQYFGPDRLRKGMGFSAVGTSTAVVDYADQFLMGSVVTPATAGIYGFAWKLAAYSLIPVRGLCVRTFPQYFRAAEVGDLRALGRLVARTGTVGMVFGGGAGLVVAATGWVLVDMVLPEFAEAAPLLFILVVPMALRAWHYTLGDALYALDAATSRVLCVWGSALFAVPASLFGMTRWGALGGAVASAVTEVVTVTLFALALRHAVTRASRRQAARTGQELSAS